MAQSPGSEPLSVSLGVWARRELGFPGPTPPEALQEVCVGSLSSQWRYLLTHVKSRAQVHHIRGNLALERHRQRLKIHSAEASILDGTTSGAREAEDERGELLAELRDLRQRIQKGALRVSHNETRIRQYKKDLRSQTQTLSETQQRLQDGRLRAKLFQLVHHQGQTEVERLSSWAKEIQDLRTSPEKSIFRTEHEEKLFAHEGADILTSAQHALTEGYHLAETLLRRMMEDPSSVDNNEKVRFQSALTQLFRRVGALEIQNAYVRDVHDRHGYITRLMAQPSSENASQKDFWTELETSGRLVSALNPSGKFKSMKQMLVDLTQKHVQSARSTSEITKAQIKANEAEIAHTLDQLRSKVAKDGLSDFERDHFMRWVQLELLFQNGTAMLRSLETSLATMGESVSTSKETLDKFTQLWTDRSREQAHHIATKLTSLELLISANSSFHSGLLQDLVSSITDLIQTDLLSNSSWTLLTSLQDSKSRQLKQFLALPSIRSLETTLMLQKSGPQRYQTSTLTIHRLRVLGGAEDRIDLDQVDFLSRLTNIMDASRSMSTLAFLDHVRDCKWKLEDAERWIGKLSKGKQDHAKMSIKTMKELIVQLEAHEKKQKDTLEPVLTHELARLDSGVKKAQTIGQKIEIWHTEPAQTTIEDDEFFCVGDLKLRKWQEKFRVALTRWQQMTKDDP